MLWSDTKPQADTCDKQDIFWYVSFPLGLIMGQESLLPFCHLCSGGLLLYDSYAIATTLDI
jgi:hypothetical protein